MADYLPEMIEAPDPVTEEVNPNINADIEMKVTEDTTEDAFAGDEEIIRQEIEEELKQEEQEPDETVPVVKARKKLQQEEVFATPKVKPVLPLAEEPRSARKKRPCSEKQKAHLKRIREKANLTHAKKRAEKKKKEEEKEKAPSPAPQPRKTQKSSGITEADVERISTEAITKYEAVRKQRKAEKKKNEAEAKHKEEIKKKINRAMRKPDPDDIWAQALGGMMN